MGGRVCQDRLANGQVVDAGPNWIHGTESNPILDIAKRTNTAVGSWDTGSYVFNEDGELYDVDEGEKYSAMMWDIVQEAFKHSNRHSAEIDPGESLLDFFKTKLVELIPETTEGWERKRGIVLQMADLWGAFVGSPVERQSLKFFWLEECIDGENLYCGGTYEHILKYIAAPALRSATIEYNTTVAQIHGRSPTDSQHQPVSVTLTSGARLAFDELVVTCPLGWLQKNPQAFDPALPPRLTKAINGISYGCLEKVYLSFPKAFWLESNSASSSGENKNDDDGGNRKLAGFAQWLSPNFALDTNPNRWTIEVVELASLAPEVSHPTLLFYIYGDQSAHIVSTVTSLRSSSPSSSPSSTTTAKGGAIASPKHQPQVHTFLDAFFRPYYTRLPNYRPDDPACRPACSYATTWLADDLAGNGSYANFQVGLRAGDEDIEVMREGWPAAGVWLAGEHTAPFVALGTATGAYWSGESVGRRVAEWYGRGGGGSGVGAASASASAVDGEGAGAGAGVSASTTGSKKEGADKE